MSPFLNVGILGATGAVGQKFVRLLDGHPWFRVTVLSGSPRSRGQSYAEAVHWRECAPIPSWARDVKIAAPSPDPSVDLVFSAVDSQVAREVEPLWVEAGIPVFTNASPLRMAADVPLLVPEVNPMHIQLLEGRRGGTGFVVANPNCSTTGLVLALKPLVDGFGVRTVQVTTLQAASGAGYPGVSSMDILGNVLPHIPGEEEKLESEPRKILGRWTRTGIDETPMTISAQTNRVPVVDGHVLSISVGLRKPASVQEAREAFLTFDNPMEALGLPSAPVRPILLMEEGKCPQPRLHGGLGGGMTVSLGGLKGCPIQDLRFVALVHNTVRGAAGGGILNAEWAVKKGYLDPQIHRAGETHRPCSPGAA